MAREIGSTESERFEVFELDNGGLDRTSEIGKLVKFECREKESHSLQVGFGQRDG